HLVEPAERQSEPVADPVPVLWLGGRLGGKLDVWRIHAHWAGAESACSASAVTPSCGAALRRKRLFHARRIVPQSPSALNGGASSFNFLSFSPQSGTSSCRT